MSKFNLSVTPISMVMEDSVHISSSGSLHGSKQDLIIPISAPLAPKAQSALALQLSESITNRSYTAKTHYDGIMRNSAINLNDGNESLKLGNSNLSTMSKSSHLIHANQTDFSLKVPGAAGIQSKSSSQLYDGHGTNALKAPGSQKKATSDILSMSKSSSDLYNISGRKYHSGSESLKNKSSTDVFDQDMPKLDSKDKISQRKSISGSNDKFQWRRSNSVGSKSNAVRSRSNSVTSRSNSITSRSNSITSRSNSITSRSQLRQKLPSFKAFIAKKAGRRNRSSYDDSEEDESETGDIESPALSEDESTLSTESSLGSLYNNLYMNDVSLSQVVVKKTKKKRHRGRLLLRLTDSEMSLLSDKTGVFNGKYDKYHRYLSGNAKLKKVVAPPPWDFLVGPSPSFTKRGKKEWEANLKNKQILIKKRDVLEELRILKAENVLLKKYLEKTFNDMNRKVSKITAENEKLDSQLISLRKERRQWKKELEEDWDDFVDQSDRQVSEVQSSLKEKENYLEEVRKDLIDLRQFKELTMKGSQAVESKKQEDKVRKKEMLLKFEKEMELLNARVKAEELEINNKLYNQVASIIDDAQLVISNLVDSKTLALYRKNRTLKHEIALHTKTHEQNQEILKDLTDINSRLKSNLESSKNQDKSKSICTPDMEFTFSFQEKP